MRTCRCIYVNCFNWLTFLAEVSTNLQKIIIFGNLRTIFQEENIWKLDKWAIFESTFWTLFQTFTFAFEESQNSFLCGSPCDPFWSAKFLNIGQKLPIRTFHHIFLESRHPEYTKKLYDVLTCAKLKIIIFVV